LDYDFWLGPAPQRPFNPNRSHAHFRNFWDYSGGVFMDFWCHITDVVYWALDLKAPLSVAAAGNRNLPDDNGETPNNLEVVYDYPGGLIMTWTVHPRGLAGFEAFDNPACAFQGTEGTLLVTYTNHQLFVKGKLAQEFKRPPQTIPIRPAHPRVPGFGEIAPNHYLRRRIRAPAY